MREGASRLVRAFFYVPEKPHFQRIDGSFCPQRERQRGERSPCQHLRKWRNVGTKPQWRRDSFAATCFFPWRFMGWQLGPRNAHQELGKPEAAAQIGARIAKKEKYNGRYQRPH